MFKKIKFILTDIVILIGFIFICFGLYIIWKPLLYISIGIIIVMIGYYTGGKK